MPFSSALVAAALSGFVALSYQILWYRALSFASGGASATFPLLIAAYLVGTAEGGWIARAVRGRSENPGRSIAGFAIAVNALCFFAIPAVAMTAGFAVWSWGLSIVAISSAALGAVVPVISQLALAPDDGRSLSTLRLYAASSIGSALGALVTGFGLTQVVATPTIVAMLASVGLLFAALIAGTATRGAERRATLAVIAVIALCAVGSAPAVHRGVYERLLFKDRYHGQRFAHVIESRHGIVALTADHHVFGGGIYEGTANIDIDADPNHLIRAFAIPALHASPKRVLIVGLGAGAWAQVIANLPSVEDVTVVDGDPGYRDLLAFNPDIAPLGRNPKAHIVVDDPRRWLARNVSERFDVVVSNTTFNWRASTSRLLSVEFMQLVRDRLAPGGLFYFNTTDMPEAFGSAFAVFPHGLRFQNFAAVSMSPVGFDVDRWHRALTQVRLDGVAPFDSTTAVGRKRIASFLATPRDRSGWFGGPMLESRTAMLQRLKGGAPITDDNMGVEWRSVYPAVYVP